MELCTYRAISTRPNPKPTTPAFPHSKPSLSVSSYNPGRFYRLKTYIRATSSEEKSTGSSQYIVEEPVTRNGYRPPEKSSYLGNEIAEKEESTEDTPTDEQTQAFEFLDKIDVKGYEKYQNIERNFAVCVLKELVKQLELDSEDTPSVLLLGGGSLVAFWIATVLVGAIDSIPLFPKLMEVVGLSYTLWFSTRYLLFKENRKELVVKIEEIKQQVLGSKSDD